MQTGETQMGEPLKILLVEDNIDHAELVIRSFERQRIANVLAHVEDGAEAIDFLLGKGRFLKSESRFKPNLILLDLRLPKIDGLETLKVIKENDNLKNIPTVILTTSANENDVAKAYNYRANSYLVKPLDFDKFNDMMKDLGFYWLCWNQSPFVKNL